MAQTTDPRSNSTAPTYQLIVRAGPHGIWRWELTACQRRHRRHVATGYSPNAACARASAETWLLRSDPRPAAEIRLIGGSR